MKKKVKVMAKENVKNVKSKVKSAVKVASKVFAKTKKSAPVKAIKKAVQTQIKLPKSGKKPITIRLLESDIKAMKAKASKMGIPYQTYINILIHKDANAQEFRIKKGLDNFS